LPWCDVKIKRVFRYDVI